MYPTNEQEALEALKGKDPELAATAEAILWGSALGVSQPWGSGFLFLTILPARPESDRSYPASCS